LHRVRNLRGAIRGRRFLDHRTQNRAAAAAANAPQIGVAGPWSAQFVTRRFAPSNRDPRAQLVKINCVFFGKKLIAPIQLFTFLQLINCAQGPPNIGSIGRFSHSEHRDPRAGARAFTIVGKGHVSLKYLLIVVEAVSAVL